ncbi:MAG: putative metal-binding motif-containing protein [Sandaracinus sp.]
MSARVISNTLVIRIGLLGVLACPSCSQPVAATPDTGVDAPALDAGGEPDATAPDASAIDDAGRTDSCAAVTLCFDRDGDMHGDPATMLVSCAVSGYVALCDDCDDRAADVHPGLAEQCNGRDDNCTAGVADETGCACTPAESPRACGTDVGVCVAGTQECVGGVWSPCSDVGGSAEVCDPTRPGAGDDEDCDGMTDESLLATGCFVDADGDSYGEGTAGTFCAGSGGSCPLGTVTRGGDCPGGPATHPGATETCNELDDNCDGSTDEGFLHVGWTTATWATMAGYDAACTLATHDCPFAFHRACRATVPPVGTCAYTTGWGIRDENPSSVDFYCATLPLQSPRWEELGAGCDHSTRYADVCFGRVDSWCQRSGYLGGFGPLSDDPSMTQVACVTGAQGTRYARTYAELATAQPLCTSSAPRQYCENAVQGWCRTHGFFGGFGPLQWSGESTEWICVNTL